MRIKQQVIISDRKNAIYERRGACNLPDYLLRLRNQSIAKGMKLLNEDEVLEEVKRRRAGEENGD